MAMLSVNLNAVAALRNRRDLPWPSVAGIARIVLEAGAAGITVHPRPDERHIRRSDVVDLALLIAEDFPDREFNIEGYPSPDFLELVASVPAHQITLVPDSPEQSTSDHGWDFAGAADLLTRTTKLLKDSGRRVSLFCDPDATAEALASAARTGADRVELFTGPYGACHDDSEAARRWLETIAGTADAAASSGLGVNAGHDLTLNNLPDFIGAVPRTAEVSIGHALTADALLVGFEAAVANYIEAASL